jgi:hypothetical protein
MVKRWAAAGMLNAERGFRRVKGCKEMPVLVAALRRHVVSVGPERENERVAQLEVGPSPNSNNVRDILEKKPSRLSSVTSTTAPYNAHLITGWTP